MGCFWEASVCFKGHNNTDQSKTKSVQKVRLLLLMAWKRADVVVRSKTKVSEVLHD